MADRESGIDDDVPALEDMSHVIRQVTGLENSKQESLSEKKAGKHDLNPEPHPQTSSTSVTDNSKLKNTESASRKKSSGNTFAGFKKGFLFAGSSKKKNVSTEPTKEDIPFIKPLDPEGQKKQYEIPEVQKAMKSLSNSLTENKEWLTDDLMSKIEKSDNLMKRLQDPTFMAAVSEFQTNPAAALEKYKDNLEMQKSLSEFCGIMGDHFTNITNKEGASVNSVITTQAENADMTVHNPNPTSAEDEKKIQAILADEEIQKILVDPRIEALFSVLRKDPDKAQSAIRDADKDLQEKIKKLVDAGLLQIQS